MEAQEQSNMAMSKEYTHMIIKGKRTKRQRPSSPLALTMSTTTSISSYTTTASPANSLQFTQSTSTTAEEDMANCLILLARGQSPKPSQPMVSPNKPLEGLSQYRCKTCDRCFPSFQALGGHRASHKKADEEKKKYFSITEVSGTWPNQEEEDKQSTILSLQISNTPVLSSNANNKHKSHECSICGAEFMSGQALGGHMRRHRSTPSMGTSNSTSTPTDSSQEAKKPRRNSISVLSLDLNLPAPEEDVDHRNESKLIPFSSNGQVLGFSASSLVDCRHY